MLTIKDVARAAGVSHTTVSRALNNSPSVRSETIAHIQKIAAELNYVANYSARSLVQQRSYTVGLFFSSMFNGTSASFLVDAIKSVNEVLSGAYTVSVNGLDSLESFASVNSRRYDGIILMSQSDSDDEFIAHVQQSGIPFVVVNRLLDDETILHVAATDRLGVEEAVDYAANLGHKQIGYIGGHGGFRASTERREGFLASMKRYKLPVRPELMGNGNYNMEGGRREMTRILALEQPPTCVFCANDDMAIGAIKACQERGMQIPADISIISFDDIVFARYTTPALTTVHKPVDEISRFGAGKLLLLMRGEPVEKKKHLIQTYLVKRESLGPPKLL